MALTSRIKNLWAKARTIDKPYAEITHNDWTFRILKAYQNRVNEKTNEFARYLCAVRSPFTYNSWDIGDTYIKDIPATPIFIAILEERERAEAEASK